MVRVVVGYGETKVGCCDENVTELIKIINANKDADVIVLPELAITGYTCRDLFNQSQLLKSAEHAAGVVANYTAHTNSIVFFGCPVKLGKSLYNCAIVANKGNVIGIVPKQNVPNYKEFEEERWFKPADGTEPKEVNFDGRMVPFGVDLIFQDKDNVDLRVGCEICEDLWMPIAPSSLQAAYGDATILVNVSASNEVVAKADYRKQLVEVQSGKCVAAYAYASCGKTESVDDVVFGGDCIIAENSNTIAQTERFLIGHSVSVDVDLEKLVNERRRTGSFGRNTKRFNVEFRSIEFETEFRSSPLRRNVNKMPFVPSDPATLAKRCDEIFNIQVSAMSKRMKERGPNGHFTIGVSGGLDSTLALLVAIKSCQVLGWPTSVIKGITMPGFGTSGQTKSNALELMRLTGITTETVDICELSLQMFKELGHKSFGIVTPTNNVWKKARDAEIVGEPGPMTQVEAFKEALKNVPAGAKDVVFENVQARARTFVLMSNGFVIGTGDMSELALGWCTYNGDHMSMYNPNCSIPKTLVKWLVKYVAENHVDEATKNVLLDIVGTTISPELLPLGENGEIVHSTEDLVGPYVLHDFFLNDFVKNGFAPDKILFLAENAFRGDYDREEIKGWLRIFLTKFFAMQFKRNCVPNGPKVGSVSLSPRGDWRMPADAVVAEWIRNLENA